MTQPPEVDFAPRRFSTDDVAEQHRLPRWREEFGRALVGVDIEPLSPEAPCQADAVMRALPGLRIAVCNGTAMHYERTPTLAAGSSGSIGLIVNLAPKALATQLGESLELSAGDAAAVLTEEAGKLTGTRHLGIALPRDVLASRVDISILR